MSLANWGGPACLEHRACTSEVCHVSSDRPSVAAVRCRCLPFNLLLPNGAPSSPQVHHGRRYGAALMLCQSGVSRDDALGFVCPQGPSPTLPLMCRLFPAYPLGRTAAKRLPHGASSRAVASSRRCKGARAHLGICCNAHHVMHLYQPGLIPSTSVGPCRVGIFAALLLKLAQLAHVIAASLGRDVDGDVNL